MKKEEGMVVALLILAGLLVVRFLLPAGTPRIPSKGRLPAEKSIALLERVRIGDCDQWVLERSENIVNPVVLFLHGGPGTSQLTLNRRNTRQLEEFFTVVNWDQRGAGKSYRAIHEEDRMTIEQFVEDTRELTLYLLRKFRKERLVLVGHSWGSAIGAMTVSRYPELYSCYVGIGQVANMEQGETDSYAWTLAQARGKGDRRAIRALEGIGPPPYRGDWRAKTILERKYVGRFGGEFHASSNGAVGVVLGSLLFSREYTFADRFNFFRGILGSMRLLWPQLLKVDLIASLTEFKVPVFFMEGRHDHEVPAAIAARYFDLIRAPSKEWTWFEQSAHMPNTEERDLFNRVMVEKVLPLAV
jgi:pimeloyl-ACP methyl ester carboxylesterase